MCVLLNTRLLWLVGRLGSVNRFNHPRLVAIVTPTDRPKSVRNRCVIEVFGCVFVLSRYFLVFFWRRRGFCHRTGSDLFLFLPICKSLSDKRELFDSERDMADIGDEYFALESLDN